MDDNPLTSYVVELLRDLGIDGAELEADQFDAANFGNAQAIYRLGHLHLRITRDRGQEFLDIGSLAVLNSFYQFGDVEVGMGWRSLEDLLSVAPPEPLADVLKRLRNRRNELELAMSGIGEPSTRARFERAAAARGAAFVARHR